MIRLTPDATSRTASRPGSQRVDTAAVAGNSRTSLRRDALRPGTGRGSMPDARPSGAAEARASVLDWGGAPPLFHPCRPCERARVVPQSSISARPQRISRRFREATDVDSIGGRSESVGTSGAGESRASVLDWGGAPPLFHLGRPCESARALAQSKTSRQGLNSRSDRRSVADRFTKGFS
jgi:hypothetical protein